MQFELVVEEHHLIWNAFWPYGVLYPVCIRDPQPNAPFYRNLCSEFWLLFALTCFGGLLSQFFRDLCCRVALVL